MAVTGFPQHVPRPASGDQLLARVDDEDTHRRIARRDVPVQDLAAVRSRVELDAEKRKPAANVRADTLPSLRRSRP